MTASPKPKRILALTGGGVRGIIEVAFLEAVEAAYKRRLGPHIQLGDIFDLVGGTSTGALIATSLSLGHPMSEMKDFFLVRARDFFTRKRWWRFGTAPVFDCAGLEAEFRKNVGNLTLGDPAVKTLLAILVKRLDTSSPWIINNIPTAPYFEDAPDGAFRGNRHFELARLLRATTAVPVFFSQEQIALDQNGTRGVFVDGGLSPYNDPSLALLKLARMQAFGLNWPLGQDNLFVLSIGTGRFRPRFAADKAARLGPIYALAASMRSMTFDVQEHALTMMEWMGTSPRPSHINSEIGDMSRDWLTNDPLFRFLRLDLPLDDNGPLGLSAKELRLFRRMDDPEIIAPLYDLTRDYCEAQLDLDALLA